MFEIGNSLREARLRQQLEFPELEQQTKIRAKYLKALEDEDFDVLPAPTYVKGFLRNYADALGLEGQLYLDEYNSRFVTGEEDTPLRPRDYQRRPQPLGPRFETRAVLVVVGAIAVVFALVIAAWKWGSSGNPQVQGVNSPGPTVAKKRQHKPAPPKARLILTATNGDCWLNVRAGSAAGVQKFIGTLTQGHQLPFAYRRIWFAASKPQNLVAQLNGRVVVIPGAAKAKPEQLLVTPTSIRKAPPAT
ncbi:MAG: helix-turn-helix domain-containing protein [Actinobacteria bacterium]|nr:MAG: helix-turn-helix domain-containing protein [Actinomycetota bacterium]